MTNKIGLTGSLYTVPVEPESSTYQAHDVPVAASTRAINGTMQTTFTAQKRRWRVEWPGLTAAQRDLLMTELRRLAHLVWEPPEGGSYTVRVQSARWEVTRDAAAHYTVVAELEET